MKDFIKKWWFLIVSIKLVIVMAGGAIWLTEIQAKKDIESRNQVYQECTQPLEGLL